MQEYLYELIILNQQVFVSKPKNKYILYLIKLVNYI